MFQEVLAKLPFHVVSLICLYAACIACFRVMGRTHHIKSWGGGGGRGGLKLAWDTLDVHKDFFYNLGLEDGFPVQSGKAKQYWFSLVGTCGTLVA